MYVEIRKLEKKASLTDKLIPPVRDELSPMLKKSEGFEMYAAFSSTDDDVYL